ncbi:MAG: esterase-like activity of phytase family protein [Fibrella sp.]|nr:esterase-like activity of phytase family protein [Armatimonadota bacterium]
MRLFSRVCIATLAALSLSATTYALSPSLSLSLIGEQRFAPGTVVDGTTLGGLSGIAYVGGSQYYAVSDDRSQTNPARFYTLGIDLSDGQLNNGDVTFAESTTLTAGGNPFPVFSTDFEDIVLDPLNAGRAYIASEGDRNRGFQPFISSFDLATGERQASLPIRSRYLVNGLGADTGIRNNLAFETLTVTPDGTTLITATESALLQDGGIATLSSSANARILTYNLAAQTAGAEFVYSVNPIPVGSNPPGGAADNGLVDMLALGGGRFLAMERAFALGVGNTVRLFEVDTAGATDVSGIDDLDAFAGTIIPVQKTLLLDLGSLGVIPDNIEGMTFGPTFADGARALILVSDDNFNPTQVTQFVALRAVTVPEAGAGTLIIPGLLTFAGTLALRRRK